MGSHIEAPRIVKLHKGIVYNSCIIKKSCTFEAESRCSKPSIPVIHRAKRSFTEDTIQLIVQL